MTPTEITEYYFNLLKEYPYIIYRGDIDPVIFAYLVTDSMDTYQKKHKLQTTPVDKDIVVLHSKKYLHTVLSKVPTIKSRQELSIYDTINSIGGFNASIEKLLTPPIEFQDNYLYTFISDKSILDYHTLPAFKKNRKYLDRILENRDVSTIQCRMSEVDQYLKTDCRNLRDQWVSTGKDNHLSVSLSLHYFYDTIPTPDNVDPLITAIYYKGNLISYSLSTQLPPKFISCTDGVSIRTEIRETDLYTFYKEVQYWEAIQPNSLYHLGTSDLPSLSKYKMKFNPIYIRGGQI